MIGGEVELQRQEADQFECTLGLIRQRVELEQAVAFYGRRPDGRIDLEQLNVGKAAGHQIRRFSTDEGGDPVEQVRGQLTRVGHRLF